MFGYSYVDNGSGFSELLTNSTMTFTSIALSIGIGNSPITPISYTTFSNYGGWSTPVMTSFCGDTLLEGSEECDDGNTVDDDGCNSSCMNEYCGDGV